MSPGSATQRSSPRRSALRRAARGLVLLVGLGPATAGAEWADWLLDADVAAQLESNANRASVASEEEWDVSFLPRARAGRAFQLSSFTRAELSARVRGRLHVEFAELHAFDVDAEASLVHKLWIGAAPRLRAFARAGYRAVRASERSGPRLAAGAGVDHRFSPRLSGGIRYAYHRRFAGGGPEAVAGVDEDVFDQQRHELTADASFAVTRRLLAWGSLSLHRGDFDSNARDRRFRILDRNDVDAVARDTVFGGWIYRVDGYGVAPSAGLGVALSRRWSLDASYRFEWWDGDGLEYRNHAATLALLFRY